LTPTEFDDYLSWPGDKHNFSREAGVFGVGTRAEDTQEMGVVLGLIVPKFKRGGELTF